MFGWKHRGSRQSGNDRFTPGIGEQMPWTNDQILEVCRIYSLNGFTLCPNCQTEVEISKGPEGDNSQHAVTFTCPACRATTTQKFMTIHPKDFILPPYSICPNCHQ